MTTAESSFPVYELVRAGIEDLAAGRESEAALVVAMASPSETDVGAHGRYNALVGRIVSFARSAEHAAAR